MGYVIVILSGFLIAMCAIGVILVGKDDAKETATCTTKESTVRDQDDITAKREREKEAHYMRNFWSYDGSEQQEWDE